MYFSTQCSIYAPPALLSISHEVFLLQIIPPNNKQSALYEVRAILLYILFRWKLLFKYLKLLFLLVLLSQFISNTLSGLYFRFPMKIRDFSCQLRGYRCCLSGYKNFKLAHSSFCKERIAKILKEKFYIDTQEDVYCISRHSYRKFLNYVKRKPDNCLPS